MRSDMITTDPYLRSSYNPAFVSRKTSFQQYKNHYGSGLLADESRISRRTSRALSSKVRTRRRIACMLAISIVLLAVLLPAREAFGGRSLVASERHAAAEQAEQKNVISIVVKQGDTLWSIAKRLEPNSDTRKVVDKLDRARDGAPLKVGETIKWSR